MLILIRVVGAKACQTVAHLRGKVREQWAWTAEIAWLARTHGAPTALMAWPQGSARSASQRLVNGVMGLEWQH